MQQPIVPAFYQQIAEQLLSKAKMIAEWGVTHPPTLGANRENTMREFLESFLPSLLRIGRGFVLNDLQEISRECDILIYDDTLIPPLYRDADVVVLRHVTVGMAIQVKTCLTKGQLNDALFNIASVKEVAPHITGVIIAFVGPSKASKTVKGWIEGFHQNGIFIPGTKQRYTLTPQTWTDYIYTIIGRGTRKGFVAELEEEEEDLPLIQMKLRDCPGLSDLFWFYRYILRRTLPIHFPSQTEGLRNIKIFTDEERLVELVDLAKWLRIDEPESELIIDLR